MIKKIIDKILANVLVFLMALMVLDVLWQVLSRYLLQSPSSFTDELARYLLIWIGVLGAAYASGQGKHLAITVLEDAMDVHRRRRLKIVHNVLIIAFSVVALVIGGGRLVYITYVLGQNSAALNIPLSLVYLIIPFSGIIIIFYKILEILQKQLVNEQ